MKKKYTFIAAVAVLSIITAIPAYASGWKSDSKGWWYEYADGTFPKSTWAQLSSGGKTSWYCFNPDGYMYSNAITPDGYFMSDSGEWTVLGKAYMDILSSTTKFTHLVSVGSRYNGNESKLIDHGSYYEVTNMEFQTNKLYDLNLSNVHENDIITLDNEKLHIRDIDKTYEHYSLRASLTNGGEYYSGYLTLAEDGKHYYRCTAEDDCIYQETLYHGPVYFSKNCIVNELSLETNEPTHLPLSLKDHFNKDLNDSRYSSKYYIDCTYEMDKNGLITQMDQMYLP